MNCTARRRSESREPQVRFRVMGMKLGGVAMKKKMVWKRYAAWMAAGILAASLAGCGNESDPVGQMGTSGQDQLSEESRSGTASGQSQAAGTVESLVYAEELFTERDLSGSFDEKSAVWISLAQDNILCDSNQVEIQGNNITIRKEGIYILSGTLEDGMILVEAADTAKVQLVLAGAEITNNTGAAIYVVEADKVFLTLADGTENALSNGGSYVQRDEHNVDGAVYARSDLTINGTGGLTVTAQAGHGLVTKDDLKVTGGNLVIKAEKQGLSGKDSVRIAGGSLNISSGTDGIHAENSEDAEKGYVYIQEGELQIEAGGDGISASAFLQIDGGNFVIRAGGGSESSFSAAQSDEAIDSMKGIKASGELLVCGGSFDIDSLDDALHSNSGLTVNGGDFLIATGDDGLHSDGITWVADGKIEISTSYEGIEGNSVVISGGNIRLRASDDGVNAAGGRDGSGFGGWDAFSGRGSFGGEPVGREGFGGEPGSGEGFGGEPGNGEGFGGEPGGRGGLGGGSFGNSPEGGNGLSENSDYYILISGGVIYIDADGDGIDSNGNLTISGGEIYIAGPENGGNGALDYEFGGQITGGILAAAGSSQMAMNLGEGSEQGSILIKTTGRHPAGTKAELKDADGQVLMSITVEKAFDSIVFSCPQLVLGEKYVVTVGDEEHEVTLDTYICGNGFGGFGGRVR